MPKDQPGESTRSSSGTARSISSRSYSACACWSSCAVLSDVLSGGGGALRDQPKARDHAEREDDDELPHGRAPSRLVRAIRPRERVWPTVIVMVVSKAW